jgi:hypothetical protein
MIEFEYIAVFEAAKEAVWIRNFVSELGVLPSLSSPVNLYCDNSGAIDRGDVKVCKVHMDHNVSIPLMKPLPQPKHESHMRSMGIRYLHE